MYYSIFEISKNSFLYMYSTYFFCIRLILLFVVDFYHCYSPRYSNPRIQQTRFSRACEFHSWLSSGLCGVCVGASLYHPLSFMATTKVAGTQHWKKAVSSRIGGSSNKKFQKYERGSRKTQTIQRIVRADVGEDGDKSERLEVAPWMLRTSPHRLELKDAASFQSYCCV